MNSVVISDPHEIPQYSLLSSYIVVAFLKNLVFIKVVFLKKEGEKENRVRFQALVIIKRFFTCKDV